MDADQLPDPATLAWAENHIGPVKVVSRYAHDHGYSRLWRLQAGADFVWLKMHTYPAKWAGELHALTHWASNLSLSPKMLASSAEPRRMLLTEVKGYAAETLNLDLPAKKRMWERAGGWLRQLHDIENDWLGGVREDGTPWGEPFEDAHAFVLRSFSPRIEEGRVSALLTQDEYDFVQFGVREWLPAVEGERARAVHRDFTPRNWMAEPDGFLTAVIDFEHARWDIRAAEMGRWWDWDFLHHPELIEVFFDAYGPADDRLKTQIRAIRMLQAATGIVWATQVKDLPFAQHNRATLHRMIAER